MTTIEALAIARTKEEGSIDLYKSMLDRYKEIGELVTFLLNEEYKHLKLIDDTIVQLKRY